VLLLLAILLAAQAAIGAYAPLPLGSPETVPVGKAAKPYLVVSGDAVQIPLVGPGLLTGYARVAYLPGETAAKSGVLNLAGVPGAPPLLSFDFNTSKRAVYGDARPGAPSGGRKISIPIPEGVFTLSVQGEAPDGSSMFVILYYDGPAQPVVAGLARQEEAESKKSPWSYRASVGIDFMYDDNITTVSDEDLIEFELGHDEDGELVDPNKFRIKTYDDFIVSPGFDIEARRKFFSFGNTRFRFKFKRFMYTTNHIKTNTDFHYYIRQDLGKGRSLEAYYGWAPEQYIRQLGSEYPYIPDTYERREFRFTRNVATLTYRHKLHKKLSAKILGEFNGRYYNRIFVENDIEAWEVRGNLSWKALKRLTLNFDYSYEDGQARARNTIEETRENSDESDPSYLRDLYRVGVTWKPKFMKKIVSRLDFSALYMDYYYPTGKWLNFNQGRRDEIYKFTFSVGRKLTKKVNMTAAIRYTERLVDSPSQSVTTDKPFDQRRYWIALTYKL